MKRLQVGQGEDPTDGPVLTCAETDRNAVCCLLVLGSPADEGAERVLAELRLDSSTHFRIVGGD